MNVVASNAKRLPGLPLAHCFLLLAGSAVLMALFRAAERFEPPRSGLEIGMAVYGLVVSFIYGPSVAGLGLAIWSWLRREHRFPTQPGHWLLLADGTATLLMMYSLVEGKRHADRYPHEGLPLEASMAVAAGLVVTVLLLAAAYQQRSDRGWRNLLAGWAVASLVSALVRGWYCLWSSQRDLGLLTDPAALALIDVVAQGALLWLVWRQRSRWRHYDGWHHLGVIVSILASLLSVLPELCGLWGVVFA